LLRRNEQLRVRVELSAPDVLLESLFTRKIDVEVTLFSVSHAGLLAEKVATSPLVCIMPRDHPLARGTVVTLADIRAFQFISFSSDTPEGRLIDDLFAQAGFDRQVAIEVRSSASACWFVKARAGIAIVDFFAVYREAFPGVVARPLHPDLAFDINICTHALAPVSDALMASSKQTKRQCRLSQRK
jgi:DNA-binding transcriptional LysR family regulator